MAITEKSEANWRVIVVGGHTRSIGKTQLVCDVIAAFPEANWVAGKITQYGHGVCAQNGHDCDCAPDEHVCAIAWEKHADTGTDSARFLQAGARRSFWLRTKQGFLAEGMPLLRAALREIDANSVGQSANLILESNTLLQFLKPSLYLMVVHPAKADFKESAQSQIDRASALVLREHLPADAEGGEKATTWTGVPLQLLRAKPQFLQREGEPLPAGIREAVRKTLGAHSVVRGIRLETKPHLIG
jgi:molybdopterin-guanine dinucleotide biosynthesis protein